MADIATNVVNSKAMTAGVIGALVGLAGGAGIVYLVQVSEGARTQTGYDVISILNEQCDARSERQMANASERVALVIAEFRGDQERDQQLMQQCLVEVSSMLDLTSDPVPGASER